EGYLYYAVRDQTSGEGFFLINQDDPYLRRLPSTRGSIRYGSLPESQARVSYLDQGAIIEYRGERLQITNENITGKHNKLNLVTCSFIALHYYPELREKIVSAASTFRPTRNRSEWMVQGDSLVFLDAYN